MSQEKTRTSVTEKLIRKNLLYTRTMTPAKVLKVLDNGWVEVDPQIQQVHFNRTTGVETPVDIGRLVRVPIGFYKVGGFIMTFPLAIGDEGILLFSDRSLDQWKITGKKGMPDSARTHNVSDAVFIPFPTSEGGAIQNYDTDNLVIGKEDGTVGITINASTNAVNVTSDSSITLTAPIVNVDASNVINLNGNTIIDGDLTVTGTTDLQGLDITGDVDIDGNLMVDGTIIATGTITSPS